MNIHNFTNRQLCEYAPIFPTVAALLDQLLFTVGNGYEFDKDTGMILDDSGIRVDEYPKMNIDEWNALIAKRHAKELKWAEEYSNGGPIDKEHLAKDCARYKIINADDSWFTEDALYAELIETQRLRSEDKFRMDDYHRPYPLSRKYSDIYNLNTNTPKWFAKIALDFCKAWVKFLDEELANNHVWIKPSLRVKTAESVANAAAMSELFDAIKADPAYDGWADNTKEPESDYGDVTWTTRHRDMLAEQVQRLEALINV